MTSSTPTQYRYSSQSLESLSSVISVERFGTYLRHASGDRRRAMRLYARNVALGGAFHGPLQTLEVVLRNAVHDTLAARFNDRWFEDASLLEENEVRSVVRATEKLEMPWTAGQVVAELNFGFWVALFARRYEERLWRTELHLLFAPKQNRKELHNQLNRLRTLRNRIAHHEPIFQRDLATDYKKILWILDMLSPEAAKWTDHHSRVYEVLDTNPSRITRF
ncbi:hypothetical protein [Candidatus Poriferisocius sp.]|uniref:hypothetical protein n=1 Tax=Candidatus Poriferisocius sp. TaxID=3101276 RepID=UPI003B02644B